MNSRIPWLDFASGVMILWVLYFHAPFAHVNILFFFMPWFFYKSGMMFRPKESREEFWNGVKKLLRVFVIWSVIGYVAYIVWGLCSWGLTSKQMFYSPLRSLFFNACVPLNNALWFLPILFVVRQIGNWLLPRVNAGWIVVCTLVLLMIFHCFNLQWIPMWIFGTTWGLFFFAFAYLVRGSEEKWWLVILSGIVSIGAFFTPISAIYGGGEYSYAERVAWYPICALGCVFFNWVCKTLFVMLDTLHTHTHTHTHTMREWRFPIVSYIGRHAMNFYVPHFILFKLSYDMVAYWHEEWYNEWQGRWIVVLSYVIFLPIINQVILFIRNRERYG